MPSLLALALTLAAPVPLPAMGGGIQVSEPDPQRWARYLEHAGFNTVQVTLYADQPVWDGPALNYGHDAFGKLPGIREEVRAAQARGLKVLLVLRVRLTLKNAANRHLWHGMIWPTEAALEPWLANYRRFALWGAARAVELGADALLIGHELNSMTSTAVGPHLPDLLAYHLTPTKTARVIDARLRCAARAEAMRDTVEPDGARFDGLRAQLEAEDATRRRWAETVSGLQAPLAEDRLTPMPPALAARRHRYRRFWRALASDVRAVYRGPIGYGANFDQFHEVDFWDALDVIGISSYFALRPLAAAGLDAALEDGWRRVAAQVEAVAGPAKRPVLLHELGWSRRRDSTVRPYSYHGVEPVEEHAPGLAQPRLTCIHWRSQPLDPTERQRALAALLRVVEAGRFPSLRGFSLWKLTTEPTHLAHEPFAALLPLPYLERRADDGFIQLAADLLARLSGR